MARYRRKRAKGFVSPKGRGEQVPPKKQLLRLEPADDAPFAKLLREASGPKTATEIAAKYRPPIVVAGSLLAESYHKHILGKAMEKELERATQYYQRPGDRTMVFSEREVYYLTAAKYKILRVMTQVRTPTKVVDDTVDAYNFLALFFKEFVERTGILSGTQR